MANEVVMSGKLRWDNARVLNGIVGSESSSLSGNDVSGTDCEYEFIYSISEFGEDDRFVYDFETFPTFEKNKSHLIDQTDEKSPNERRNGGKRKVSQHSKVSSVSFDTSACDIHKHGKVKATDYEKCKLLSTSLKHGSAAGMPVKEGRYNHTVRTPSGERQHRLTSVSTTGDVNCEATTSAVCASQNSPDKHSGTSLSCEQKRTGSADERRMKEFQDGRQRRQSVSYDPALEKASAFLHGGGKNFSRANTSVTPIKYGLKHLQINYTESNLENNDSVLFLDLLKHSLQKNYIRGAAIKNIEKRLEIKRKNAHYFTSFYEHKQLPDPLGRDSQKTARSVAQKKLERKKKIKTTTDELLTGYVPTALTMKIADREEVEDIGRQCRYLRCKAPPLDGTSHKEKVPTKDS